MDLKDKVAIVTGASAGIGAATVKALLKLDMKVVGFARRKERIEQLADDHDGKLFAVSVDVSKEEEIIKGFAWVTEHVGPVHVLINNAGVSPTTDVVTGHSEVWRKIMDTNFMSVAIASKEAIQIMQEHRIDGYIINMASIAGRQFFHSPGVSLYSSSKFALLALTENIRLELVKMGSKIRISSISPGLVHTEVLQASRNMSEAQSNMIFASAPCLESEDIANAIIYLLTTPVHVQVTEMVIRPVGDYIK